MFKYFDLFRFFKKSFVYNKITVLIIIVLSIIFSLVVWFASKNYYDNLIKDKFETNVLENMDRIEKRMSSYKSVLQSGIGFFRGSEDVSKQEWHDFVDSLDLKTNYPGIQGIGYSVMLTPEQVAPTEEKMRQEGFKSFTVKPQGKRAKYSAILYLEPLDIRNIQAIGYDMYSEPVRRQAMQTARDTGLPSISGKVTLVQEIDSDVQPGMLMYLPLYKKHTKTDSVEERRKALIGFVYSAFRMNDLMDKLVLEKSVLNFEIYDGSDLSEEHLLYRSFTPSSYISKYNVEKKMKIDNRTWIIHLSSTRQFDISVNNYYPLMMTIIGLTIYFFLLFIILSLIKSRYLLLSQADELLKLSKAIEQSPNSIVITDTKGDIEYVNLAFLKCTGHSREDTIGKNLCSFQDCESQKNGYEDMMHALSLGKQWEGEIINWDKDKVEHTEFVKASPIFQMDKKVYHYIIIKEDITEKKYSQERIHRLANFDSLTGLPNRLQLEELTQYVINTAKRNNEHFAIMFLDLDHFKDINDTLGHSVGDNLLVEMAKRFESVLRDVDTVARLGGDEFIFLLPKTDMNGVQKVADKLLLVIDKPFKIDSHELMVTASIGIAIYPQDGLDQETLAKNADAAMYMAKKEGRNKYYFYTNILQKDFSRNLQLSNALHHAIDNNELSLVYQPQFSMTKGCVIGAEALLRWKHPEFGNIEPAEFIPLAEESGKILSIGEWVLKEAIVQAKKWQQKDPTSFIMAVNISSIQFRQMNFVQKVTTILDEIGLPPECLELELTEAVAMHSYDVMDNLHEQGIRMSIDDFGTGYSSLSYLKKLKVSKLKIDQSFIHDIWTDPDDKAIVSAIINMSNRLGIRTIAEGVETAEQLQYLREQGCDEVQGYYYSEPLSPEEFEKFMKADHRRDNQSVF
ncbi:EAL domain-containing protein [Sulfurimonas sp. HSL-1716]|uniref:EAL domain-containing protein n=1 Tax=Hydrocurvibacter sulfurireducens TaxID=3131937 RepID=UPI0031F9ACF6